MFNLCVLSVCSCETEVYALSHKTTTCVRRRARSARALAVLLGFRLFMIAVDYIVIVIVVVIIVVITIITIIIIVIIIIIIIITTTIVIATHRHSRPTTRSHSNRDVRMRGSKTCHRAVMRADAYQGGQSMQRDVKITELPGLLSVHLSGTHSRLPLGFIPRPFWVLV